MTDTKKPAGLVPYGLSVLHRTYPDHDLGWRELNPRPKFLHTIFILTKSYFFILNHGISVNLCLLVLLIFSAMPPKCRHLLAMPVEVMKWIFGNGIFQMIRCKMGINHGHFNISVS
ncbi:hypothetical protein DB992_04170 [Salmonella enterica]|nr:hypothetical protein [Salmonella enterica]EBN4819519.1 hypothetical protein [Salmonella enterica]